MIEVRVPELGESIESAQVARVLVNEGDTIEAEQAIIELESDKAAMEMPSPEAGTVKEILVKQGDEVEPGQVILKLSNGAEAAETADKAETAEEAETAEKAEEKTEEAEEKTEEAEEKTEEAEEKTEEAEEKTEGGEDRGGEMDEEVEEAEEADKGEKPPQRVEDSEQAEHADKGDKGHIKPAEPGGEPDQVRATGPAAGPATRRLARELGVRVEDVTPSGPGGRVTREDVKAFVRERGQPMAQTAQAGQQATQAGRAPAVELPDFSRWGEIERLRMSRLERTGAVMLKAAWTDIPHVSHHDQADITELEAARLRYLEHHGEIRLTITALIIKAVAALLERYPRFNSSVDMRSEEVIYKRYIHIGVAVDTERGLLVPVLRDADRKTTAEIAVEIERLAGRARSGELGNDEMEGGTFSITNLGGIGGTSFTPIIRAPEVAILGVSRARPVLVRRGQALEERLFLPLSLSYDHRVINGADAARFTRGLAELLEEPLNLLMEC
jgi:pyruvate dehydrogenase E2 component (dihydrolipoamide acetyltransferase)